MKKFAIFLCLILIGSTLLFSKDAKEYSPYLEFSPKENMRTNLNLSLQQNPMQDSSKIELYNHPDYILPKKVLFFSALIPGAGELYCKSYLKSAAFFAVEVGVWTMYAVFRKKAAGT